MRFPRILVFSTAALLLAAGCAGGGKKGEEVPPGVVQVSEKEFSIAPSPSTVSAGRITFRVKNDGSIEHNFVVLSADKKKVAELDAIKPGQSQELVVQLQAGEYRLVCTVPGHEEAGMHTTIRVQ
ncbi:MAG: cupredoxin domain-containing protein [bacterium]